MTKLQNFRHIELDPSYDKIQDPKRLTVRELLPVGASWEHNGQKYEVLKPWGVLAVPSNDFRSIAIVEGPFETEQKNRAYVMNADGSVRFEINKPSELTTSSFSDVYYVSGELCFFSSGSSGDFRLSINEIDGTISKINPSR
ncbi:hypothetical protein [Massilia orientalis]|uniref:Uncharacterized protein n=1 Tax=Massilia orientalis TaxID=3050128 RepID=A0ACC7MB31_9BURK|nr:hypothetical protein [Massilia sp. YIM B02787]